MKEQDEHVPTPSELRQWLQGEVREVMKAAELRIQDATDFVTAYAVGEISAKEAAERMYRYDRRWPESIPGLTVAEGMTDEEVLRRLDKAASMPEKDWAKQFKQKELAAKHNKAL